MGGEGGYLHSASYASEAKRINDKIEEVLTLGNVAPSDFVEYLETWGRSH